MSAMSDRLKAARIAAGFRSGSDAAEKYGWKTPTYLGHENGSRSFGPEKAQEYAQAFGIDAGRLLLGGDLQAIAPPVPRSRQAEIKPPEEPVSRAIDEDRAVELLTSSFVLLGLGADEARNIVQAILRDCRMPASRSRSEGLHPGAATLLKRFSSH